jgi:hypothetical protein
MTQLPTLTFTQYHTDEAIRVELNSLAHRFPALLALNDLPGHQTTGQSGIKAILTNRSKGAPKVKPAVVLALSATDGARMPLQLGAYLIQYLVTQFGSRNEVTRLLNENEIILLLFSYDAPQNRYHAAEPTRQLTTGGRMRAFDIDGDGRQLWMRIQDSLGARVPHPDEPSLLIGRDPADFESSSYRILPEGGLGSGVAPLSSLEAETRVLADEIASHPNAVAVIMVQGSGGTLAHPTPNADLHPAHAAMVTTMARSLETRMGLRQVDQPPKQDIINVMKYLDRRADLFVFHVSPWHPAPETGLALHEPLSPDDELRLLRALSPDERARCYVDWYEYDHPQFGKVELGGWNIDALRNPPDALLKGELEKLVEGIIWLSSTTPQIKPTAFEVEPRPGTHDYFVRLTLENTGWMPSDITGRGYSSAERGIRLEIMLGEDMRLICDEPVMTLPTLQGRSHISVRTLLQPPQDASAAVQAVDPRRVSVSWLVEAPYGGDVIVRVIHPCIESVILSEEI